MANFSGVATGDVYPSRFVKKATSDGKVTQAGAGEKIFGISHEGTRYVPWSATDDGKAAISGETLPIYGPGWTKDVLLEIAGTVAPGDRLKSDSNGKGVATTTNLDEYGAIAMVNGVSGQLIAVQPVFPSQISS